jgi:hypothetical protein
MTQMYPHDIKAETITIENAMLRWRVSRTKISKSIEYGRLQSVKFRGQRLLVIRSMQQLMDRRRPTTKERRAEWRRAQAAAAELEPQSTAVLPELHRLIEQIRPHYPENTIAGLLAIVAAAETRLERAVT